MTQTIKIKRSTGSSAPSTLAQGELAYSKGSGFFYVGDPAAVNTPIQVNGAIVNNAGTPALGSGITKAELRTFLDVDSSGTDNSTNVSLNAAITDVFSISGQQISAVDGTADRLVFWDDSASKLTYMTPSALKDFASLNATDDVTFNDLTVTGNLTITGDIDSYNVTDLDVTDKTITVNVNGTEAGSDDSGLKVYRGSIEAAASILWDEPNEKFSFSDGIRVNDQTVIASTARIYADDGTTVKAGYGFESSATTGLSYTSSGNRINFLSGGAVRAYIQTGGTNPITNTFYVDGRSEFTDQIGVTGDGNSGNWKSAYDFSTSGDFTGNTFTLDSDHSGAALGSGTAQIEVERGSDANAFIRYNHALSVWEHGVGSGVKKMGTITSITGGNGLNPDTADVDGAVTLSVDLSELTDMTADVVGSEDELILLDDGADRRKLISEIKLSAFNNDSGFTSNVGDITGVTLRNNSDQSPADTSIVFGTSGTNTASGTNDALTFRMAVGTIDGGTY